MAPVYRQGLRAGTNAPLSTDHNNDRMSDLFALETSGWVEVAVDAGLDAGGRGLTYAIDPQLQDLRVGESVLVPLGRRNRPVRGWVVDRFTQPPAAAGVSLKHVLSRVDGAPVMPADLIDLARWIAGYYITSLGPTLAAMLPPRGTATGTPRQRRWIQPVKVPSKQTPRLGASQLRILDYLGSLASDELPVERRSLVQTLNLRDAGGIDRLLQRGLLVEVAAPTPLDDSTQRPTLTPAQRTVVDSIGAKLHDGFSSHLLLGVTGAGKTEVYLRLIEQVVLAGQAAMLLVPEIMLTPQAAQRLDLRFGGKSIAVLHSGISVARRRAAWRDIEAGEVDIVLGARSAVFAPFTNERLGLIVVDEEHDASYRQDTAPRYHGRDVALRRAQMAGCPAVLGSATPCMESWANATAQGRHVLHRLPDRAPGLTRPKVRIVDRIEERRNDPGPQRSLGPTLRAALGRTLDAGGQALLLLNRRGWATFIACRRRACGWVMRCDHCDTSLVFHRKRDLAAGGTLKCHHCLSQVRMPGACPLCRGPLARLGEGSQRLEDEISQLYPSLTLGQQLVRLDVDTRGSGDRVQRVMDDLQKGTIRVLVGTQMIAKGLDLPGIQLVGVVDADTALHLPDFRAAERTFQLVAQVAGRCGRGSTPGLVVIQTCCKDDPAIELASKEQFERFADLELQQRTQAGLPPARRMARLIVEHENLQRVRQDTDILEQRLKSVQARWQVSGGAPCPVARIAARHRWQLEVFAADAASLSAGLQQARGQQAFVGLASILVDVDPLQLQ